MKEKLFETKVKVVGYIMGEISQAGDLGGGCSKKKEEDLLGERTSF